MKKMMMLAAMAMMAVTAQAVSISWAADSGRGTQVGTVSGIADDTLKIAVSAIVVLDDADFAGHNEWGILTYNYKTNVGFLAYAPGTDSNHNATDGGIGFRSHAEWAPDYAGSNANGTYSIEMVFERADTDSNWAVSYSWTSTAGDDISGTASEITSEQLGLSNGSFQLETGAVSGISLDIDSVAVVASVPEPTALALLALGVAGLALKRKMK